MPIFCGFTFAGGALGLHFFSHHCCSSCYNLENEVTVGNKLSPPLFDQILKTRDLGPPLIPSEQPSPQHVSALVGSLHFSDTKKSPGSVWDSL